MPVSGVVVTFTHDAEARDRALAALRRDRSVELGRRDGVRIAAVLDTPSEDENRRLWQWLNALPGVCHVDVVFVSFDDEQPYAAPESSDDRGRVEPCR